MISREQVLGLIRHFITIIGGIYISRGVIDGEIFEQAIGSLFAFVGSFWSLAAKRKKSS